MWYRNLLGLFSVISHRGSYVLGLGLMVGIVVPQLAIKIKPYLGLIVCMILFVNSYRIGWTAIRANARQLKHALIAIVALQLLLPVCLAGGFALSGFEGSTAFALVLMATAPTITGTPNIATLCGYDDAPALRLLMLGTFILPITASAVFVVNPFSISQGDIVWITLRLSLIVFATCGAGFLLRAIYPPQSEERQDTALNGLAVLLMFFLVIGLMSVFAPALMNDPTHLLGLLALAIAACLGLQAVSFYYYPGPMTPDERVATSIVAGCRNMALFIAALPEAIMEPLLIFIACYQIPMFLTPLLTRRLYRKG